MTNVNDNKIIQDLLCEYDNNNANMRGIGGSLEYSLFEHLSKKMITHFLNPEWVKAEKEGFVYAHDKAQYLFKGLNCFTHDIRRYIRFGLSTYGDNSGVVSKPPNHFRTVLELSAQAMGLASCYMAGGQAIAALNTFVAPFMEKMSDKHVKQDIQAFLFQLNQSFMNRGCQSVFSSINMDLEMPEWLQKETAYGKKGEIVGEYGDFYDESKRFVHLLNEVSIDGDGNDKPLFFPNLIYNIPNADLREWKDIFELSAKFSTPYFCNYIKNGVKYQSTLGCFGSNTCLWVKIDGELKYLSFAEIDKLLNADIGVTPVNNIEVLSISDSRKIKWFKAKNFIKNDPQELYKVKLSGNKEFLCDKNHTLITAKGLSKKSIFSGKGDNAGVNGIIRKKVSPDLRSALYGFYMGDGKKGNDFDKGYANIMLLKKDKIEYVRNLLKDLHVDFKEDTVYHKRDDKLYTVFYFNSKEIIEPDLKDVNQCAGLISGMLSSDGYIRVNGEFNNSLACEFVSTEQKYANMFKFACFNLGIKFSSRIIKPSKTQKNKSHFERVYISCNYESVNIIKQLLLRQNQKDVVESINNNFRHINEVMDCKIKSIEPIGEIDNTYCFEVNDRIIVESDFILTGNCRSAQPANWTGDPNIDCMGTGNSVYTTISLPAIALKSVYENKNFINELVYYMSLIRDFNKMRLEWIRKLWYTYHTANFLIKEDDNGVPLYRLNDATIVLGYLGLSEALEILYGKDITQLPNKAREIIKFMRDEIARWKVEDNLRWGLFQTPAENLAYTNAKKMVEQYGFKRSKAKGNKDAPFYTNSNHVPVNSDINLIQRIKLEGNNQPLGAAGNIMNVYLGESYSEPTALLSLCEKIRDNCNAYFWAFTGDFSMCPSCLTKFKGAVEQCGFCGSETDVFSRVTGYMTVTKSWNKGKKSEHKLRHRYEVTGGLE